MYYRHRPARLARRQDRLLEDFAREFIRSHAGAPGQSPPVEIAVTDDHVIVQLLVPGAAPDTLSVDVRENTVEVRGEAPRLEEPGARVVASEIRRGAFHRAIALPEAVDAARASARLRNGVLCITVPHRRRAHRVPIGG
jgi:HSP20 family molecular chaperone IbpA